MEICYTISHSLILDYSSANQGAWLILIRNKCCFCFDDENVKIKRRMTHSKDTSQWLALCVFQPNEGIKHGDTSHFSKYSRE